MGSHVGDWLTAPSPATAGAAASAAVDLVVLSDYLVADQRMVRDLHTLARPAPSGSSAGRHRPGGPAGDPRHVFHGAGQWAKPCLTCEMTMTIVNTR